MLSLLIPPVSAVNYALGGCAFGEQFKIPYLFIPGFNPKLWRWLIGIPIGFLAWHGWLTFLLTVATYFIATSGFIYGEKSWLNFLGQKGKHFVSGLAFGLACWPILGIAALWQGIVSGIVFLVIESKGVDNPFAELGRGLGGTMIFFMMG